MIPHKKEHEFKSSGVGKSNAFTFEMNVHMAQMLSDGLYSDKYAAPPRELTANAYDAMAMANNPAAPIVHMCTAIEPWWSIEDFGIGMDEDEFDKYFCSYGSSNKRESNVYTGEKGLGCKAWAAYTSQATVICTKDGVRRTFTVYKDETGMPSSTKLSEATGDFPNGVKVSFGVLPGDVGEFQETCRKIFRRFKDPAPIIEGHDDFIPDDLETVVDGRGWLMRKETSRGYYSGNATYPVAIQGHIAYPINPEDIEKHLDEDLKMMAKLPLDIEFENGTISAVNSREALEYNDQTIRSINDRFLEIKKELQDTIIPKIFTNCATKWEAVKALGVSLEGSDNRDYQRLVESAAEYNGESVEKWLGLPLDERNMNGLEFLSSTSIHPIAERRFGNMTLNMTPDRIAMHGEHSFHGKTDYLVIRMNPETITRGPSRLQKYLLGKYGEPNTQRWGNVNKYPQVIVIKAPDDEWKYIKDHLGGMPVHEFDDLVPEYKVERSVRVAGPAKATSTASVYKYNGNSTYSYSGNQRSQLKAQWDITTLPTPLTVGYYVDLRQWGIKDAFQNIDGYAQKCRQVGILDSDTIIYGIPGGQKNPCADNKKWVNLVSKFGKTLEKWEKSPDAPDQASYYAATRDNRVEIDALAFFNDLGIQDYMSISHLTRAIPFKTSETIENIIDHSGGSNTLAEGCKTDWSKIICDKYAAVLKEYPMLSMLSLDTGSQDTYNRGLIKDYIKLIQSTKLKEK